MITKEKQILEKTIKLLNHGRWHLLFDNEQTVRESDRQANVIMLRLVNELQKEADV